MSYNQMRAEVYEMLGDRRDDPVVVQYMTYWEKNCLDIELHQALALCIAKLLER